VGACSAPHQRQVPPPPAVAPPAGPPPPQAGYRIDPAQSEIRLLVYRAGPLARLGHNHVIVNRALGGWVAPRQLPDGSFSLDIPVAAFVVDERAARASEGPDFDTDVSEDARSGTFHNMLSPAVLDADRYPVVTVKGTVAAMPAGGAQATVTVVVAGHESRLTLPFVLEAPDGALAASGTAVLRQSALGLTPLSIMLGALQVQDELTVKFKIVARVDRSG
jgi:hypothetical protein